MSTKQSQPVSERLSDGHGSHLYFKNGKLKQYVNGQESDVGGGSGSVKVKTDTTKEIDLQGKVTVTAQGLLFESNYDGSEIIKSNWTGMFAILRLQAATMNRYFYAMSSLAPFPLKDTQHGAYVPVIVDGSKSYLTIPFPSGYEGSDVLQWADGPAVIQVGGLAAGTKPACLVTWKMGDPVEIDGNTYIQAPHGSGLYKVGEWCHFYLKARNPQMIE